jgi:hypothetical protein
MSEHKSVWLLTTGGYSDYYVIGAFSTKDLAEEARLRIGGPEEDFNTHDIEELDLDCVPERRGGYRVSVRLDRASQAGAWHRGYGSEWTAWDNEADPHAAPRVEAAWGDPPDKCRVEGYGPTSEHARRSADELARAIVAGAYIVEKS